MRRPGREFGSERPRVVYVALRWNGPKPKPQWENNFVEDIAKKLGCDSKELRIYNLCHPSKGRGMPVSPNEYDEVVETIFRIKAKRSVRHIVVGGKTGNMPLVAALLLKLVAPKVSIKNCNHHRAWAVNGGPLGACRILRR